jgi:anaerobic magnesium-protoporphyrin IX monomethyl ester cyclase
MKIVLVTPPYQLLKEGYGVKAATKYGYWPRLGLAYLASTLLQNGYQVEILDAPVMGLSVDEAARAILALDPDVIGITTLLSDWESSLKLAEQLKLSSSVPIIMGGPYASAFSEDIFENSTAVDMVVRGEAEQTMLELARCFDEGKGPDGIAGVWYRKDGRVIKNPPRPPEKDLDRIPFPARHLFHKELYRPFPFQVNRTPIASVMASRGCTYGKCSFCTVSRKWGYHYRRRSPKNVIEEIKDLNLNQGYREIFFWDSNFIVKDGWIEEFCAGLMKERLDLTWLCLARVDSVTPDILRVMAKAGCVRINFGLESGNPELLETLNKNITLEQSRNAVKWCKEVGIQVKTDFIIGIPGETPAQGLETIKFAIECNAEFAEFSAFSSVKNMEIYDLALRYQAKNSASRDINFKGRYVPAYATRDYGSTEEVDKMVKRALKRFYLRPSYLLRSLARIKSIEDLKRYVGGFIFFLKVS